MLSRRHLRIKALQSLYAFFIIKDLDIRIGEKNMMKSTEKIYGLITYQLSFLIEIVRFASKRLEEAKHKFYPTPEELNPNTKFVNNLLIRILSENEDFLKKSRAYRISWSEQQEMVRTVFLQIRDSSIYKSYMSSGKASFNEDKALIAKIFKSFVATSEWLASFYEETDIYWGDDIDIANTLVIKIINDIEEEQDVFKPLPPLFNADGKEDPDEDKKFLVQLYDKTILKSQEFDLLIQQKASNWELDRIALMDIILLKMALTEFLEFPSIPLKVTMNEYIELSKYYSTPKSRMFINGILDKIREDLKNENMIKKVGRGLIEE